MQQWHEGHPGDVQDEEAFYAAKRKERRADRRRRRKFAEQELENPFSLEMFTSTDLKQPLDQDRLRRVVYRYLFYISL
jgi:hypothetical protein